jgi:hypothetical protein
MRQLSQSQTLDGGAYELKSNKLLELNSKTTQAWATISIHEIELKQSIGSFLATILQNKFKTKHWRQNHIATKTGIAYHIAASNTAPKRMKHKTFYPGRINHKIPFIIKKT